ncbi:zona pellucida glycoprotein d [Synchiropus picturatus]
MTLSAVVLLLLFTKHCVDGACRVEACTDPSRCLLSKDERSCKCAVGFYGDLCDKDAHMTIACTKDYISVRAVEDFFKYHKVPADSLHLPNISCRAHKEIIDDLTFYVAKITKDQYLPCGGKPLEKNFTHISYSLSLLSDPQVFGNIIRDPIIKLEFTCVYPYIRRVSLPFPVVPFSSETVMRVDDLDATIQMMLFTDETYSSAFTSAPTIELRDKVYVELTVTEPADFFLLRVNECWATQTPEPNATEGSYHSLLLNGCVNDPTVSFLNVTVDQSGLNGQSSSVRYSFEMFRFTTEPNELYLHCTVQLCEPDDLLACTPVCHTISKREAVRPNPAQGLLSYGPIKIEMKEQLKSGVLTTVVVSVTTVWTVGFFLVLFIVVIKAGTRRLTLPTHY